MNYSDLSDFEINKLVAESQQYTTVIGEGKYPIKSEDAVYLEQRTFEYEQIDERYVDYCNKPSDAWPIIVKNKISINCYEGGDSDYWEASSYDSKNNEKKWQSANDDKNPLRAAMIVYLMMNCAENEI